MGDDRESICCCEVPQVWQKVDQWVSQSRQAIDCITDHPGFEAVSLNPWVLETAYMQYKQEYGRVDGDQHE